LPCQELSALYFSPDTSTANASIRFIDDHQAHTRAGDRYRWLRFSMS
jgi:hypothetical protein